MDRLILLLFFAVACFAGGMGLERRPHIDVTVPIPFWRPHLEPPDGLKVQRDNAVAAGNQATDNLRQCRINKKTLGDELDRQTKSITDLGRESATALAKASADLAQAAEGRASAEARAKALLDHPPSGIDSCARMFDADEAVLRSLQ